ncbi:MAG: hypothetical protein QOI61_346, partial [Actinomycetota bacterium]
MAVDNQELTTELAGLDALEADLTPRRPLAQRIWP